MTRQHSLTRLTATLMSTAAILGLAVSPVAAQDAALVTTSFASGEVAAPADDRNALEKGRYAVLIDLDENRLYFKQGDLTLWSAPVGTGTGLRVITHGDDWDFSTPTGRFQVQYKERDPIWIAPDWFFVENNLPVPPPNDPSRYMTGTLGEAAVYIAPDLAIHGTNRPELLGERVSHGCIRLENRYALRLFHNVQVGTEVIIVGGEKVRENARVVDLRNGYDPSLASSGGRKELPVDEQYEEWRGMPTGELIEDLEDELREPRTRSRWDEVAILLLNRAAEDDERALDALLNRAGDLPTSQVEREWATFLGEIYRRSAARTLEAIARLDRRDRERMAEMLVTGSLTLYAGEFTAASAPWPTSRIPRDVLSRRAQRGWDSLVQAEREHRAEIDRAASLE
ncbi:MAG: L,D-transpeptidase [Gemmatimonadota bacterium]